VPSVIGGSVESARAVLEAIGLTLVEGTPIEMSEESQNGLIVTQSPGGDEWAELGTAVTVQVGVYIPPEEPPEED
jgi:beta-lactam-binding protein with PASTA domain